MSMFDISEFEWIFLPENRIACFARACITISFICLLDILPFLAQSSPTFTRGTCIKMSTLSRIGPERRDRYRSIASGEHIQGFSGSPINQHGHGFIAPTSENRAGYLHDWLTRLMVISPSSIGCLSVSRSDLLNSRNSSRKRTHLWARDISPGFESRHHPMTDASLAVWWMMRNGRSSTSGKFFVKSHATEYIFESSIFSSRFISGSMPASAFPSIVFPDPGGHCMRILCPPAADMRSALFACSCPIICEKSTLWKCDRELLCFL